MAGERKGIVLLAAFEPTIILSHNLEAKEGEL